MEQILKELVQINYTSTWLLLSAGSIAFNPTFWNVAARSEFHYKSISKLIGNNRYYGCLALAFCVFTLGLFRDWLYATAPLGHLLSAAGGVLVLSSMWRLGITGTYLGDYFGLLKKARVTGFPFNLMNNPMYNGSTLVFLGQALANYSTVGILLSLEVHLVYRVALLFEEPFTAKIYSKIKK